jgi:hypothetical protein
MEKKLIVLLCFAFIAYRATCQDTMVVNLLKAPVSPVSQLLNFAPSIIEKPSDIPALWLSIQNSTSNLSKFPNSYAIDLSPAEIFKSKDQTLESLRRDSAKPFRAIGQTFVLSFGFQSFTDSTTQTTYPKLGLGFKTSIIRARWDASTNEMYNALIHKQDTVLDLSIQSRVLTQKDTAIIGLRSKLKAMALQHGQNTPAYRSLDSLLIATESQKDSINYLKLENNISSRIKISASKFAITRHGWSLDLAGGFTAAFPSNNINYSVANNAGVWLTGGYLGIKKVLSILAIARYLYQPDSIFAAVSDKVPTAKVSTFDAGLSLNITSVDTKLNMALEGIYRSVLNKNTPVAPSWHVVVSASYNLGNNKLIGFNFGRDFDGVLSTGGNLIAGINLILGFGGGKSIPQSSSIK